MKPKEIVPRQYIKKGPQPFTAFLYTGDNLERLKAFLGDYFVDLADEGVGIASVNDRRYIEILLPDYYIIKDLVGSSGIPFHSVRKDDFERSYEPTEG